MGDTYMAPEVRDTRDFDGALHVKVRFSLFVEYEGEDWGRGHPQCCSLRGQSRHSRFIRHCATPRSERPALQDPRVMFGCGHRQALYYNTVISCFFGKLFSGIPTRAAFLAGFHI